MTDYSEPVDWLKMLSDGTSGPTARAVEALQADRDHWKARAERAEAVVEAAKQWRDSVDSSERVLYQMALSTALEHQEGEQ